MREILLVALLFAMILVVWYRWRHVILPFLARPIHMCPRCYGELDCDAEAYKHTLLWTCRDCKHTYETLREKR